jgi:glycogen debranching enzyme
MLALPFALAEPSAGQELTFEKPETQKLLGAAYKKAVHNLLEINTVPDAEKHYNRTGLFRDPPGTFFRAGGDYHAPWTRDASINSWNAGSLLAPDVARNTLWAVCQRQAGGKLIVQRDKQWWDKVIWGVGAWSHYAITGDRDFLTNAYQSAVETLHESRQQHRNADYGLFEGGSVLNDGIAGYPEPPFDPKVKSTFVLDHPGGAKLMALSTNCVYVGAYRCAAQMAKELGRPENEVGQFQQAAEGLQKAVNRHFWMPEKSTYGYFIHGVGPLAGKLDASQEGLGLAFAILFDVASPEQIAGILRTVHLQPKGIVCVWPHFARFSDAQPGRHNVMVWPMVSGMWAHAAAKAGATEMFRREMTGLAQLANQSGGFYEIYHSVTGAVDGGWQSGPHWDSCANQTWSATGYLRMVFYGLFGMDFQPDGLYLAPTLPGGWGPVQLTDLKYRGMTLTIALSGQGNKIADCELDGRRQESPLVPAGLTGRHQVKITLKQ